MEMIRLKKYYHGHMADSITDTIPAGIETLLVRRGIAEYVEDDFLDKHLEVKNEMVEHSFKDKLVNPKPKRGKKPF